MNLFYRGANLENASGPGSAAGKLTLRGVKAMEIR